MVGTLDQMIADMKAGVFDYTKDGKCSDCGQCCADFLPMSDAEVETIRRYIRKHNIKEQVHRPPTTAPVLDTTCPFRNNEKRRCEIYPVRPMICKDFRCDKPSKEI